MVMTDEEIWSAEFSCIDSLYVWNANVIKWMQERPIEYKKFAHAEAKRRGYEFDKKAMSYTLPWRMFALRGRNVIAAGWNDGTLRIAFAGKDGAKFWRYEGVPEDTFVKLKNVPFPDKLFHQLVKSKGYKATAE